jgi:hypothetical protein
MIEFFTGYRCGVKRTNRDARASQKYNNGVPQAHWLSGKF